jgi:hypothetical protein
VNRVITLLLSTTALIVATLASLSLPGAASAATDPPPVDRTLHGIQNRRLRPHSIPGRRAPYRPYPRISRRRRTTDNHLPRTACRHHHMSVPERPNA